MDPDDGLNGEVRYRLRRELNQADALFTINELTGLVQLAGQLDRETAKTHALRVEAYDLGQPTPLQTDLDLTVYVVNVNDHRPQFIVDRFTINMTENQPAGSQARTLLKTVDLDDVEEDDVRLDVCYYIVAGNADRVFQLHPTSHALTALQTLDRETRSEYRLVVWATDQCSQPPPPPPSADSVDPELEDASLLEVVVFVNDENDNAPVFTQRVFTGGVSTDLAFGTSFMRVEATDLDDGANAVPKYTVCGPVQQSRAEGLAASPSARPTPNLFTLDADSGEVRLNFDPQENQKGYFSFPVCAEDAGGLVDRARVVVYLLRQDQRVKFVTRSQPQEIRNGWKSSRYYI